MHRVGWVLWIVCLSLWGLGTGRIQAVNYTWNVDADGNWSSAANWNPSSGYPKGNTDDAFLLGIVTSNRTITLTENIRLHSMTVSNANTYTFTGARFEFENQDAVTFTQDGSGSVVFDSGVRMQKSGIFTGNGSGQIIINGLVDQKGTQGLVKQGTSTLVLNNNNTFAGGLTIDAGTVEFGNDGANGTGTLTLNGGTLLAGGGARTLNEAVTVGGNFTVGGTNSLTLSGAVNLGSVARTVTVDNTGGAVFSGALSGTGGLAKGGSGTLTLSGNNTFSGGVTLNAGTLLLGASDRIADGNAVTLAGGELDTGGYNETLGTLTLTADSIIDLGDGASVLHFSDSSAISWTANTTITVTNWSGSQWGGGTDQLYFGSNTNGLTSGQLAQIRFVGPNGYNQPGMILASGEVTPTPEPATWAGLLGLTGLLAWRERKRLGRVWGKFLGA